MNKPLEALFFRDWNNSHIPEILEEMFLKKVYGPYLVGKRDLTIVDGGQNIGLFSYYAKNYAKRIIGLEPSAMHRETCQKMLDFNKITNVEILPYGLSNKKEKKKFYLHENSTMYSLTQLGQNVPFEEIEVISVDDLFTLGKIDRIDILKADFEGEEGKIFASEAFKKHMDQIPVILGEWHDWCNISQDQFANMFTDYNYQFNWIRSTRAACFSAIKL